MLLSDSDYCSGQQVNLGVGSTSVASANRVQSVPLLPVPFINSSSTRVILQTGVASERLRQLIKAAHPSESDQGGGEQRGGEREFARPLSATRIREILQQLLESDTGSTTSREDSKPLMIGARDFNLMQMKGSREEWRCLEEVAARGPQGTPRENFQPSVVVMDESTDNSSVPHCVVNGE